MPTNQHSTPLLWQDFENLIESALVAAKQDVMLYRFVIFAAISGYCGLPPRTVLQLRWCDVYWIGSPVVRYRSKSKDGQPGKWVIIPQSERLKAIIPQVWALAKSATHRDTRDISDLYFDSIVPSASSGGQKPMSFQYLNRWLKEIASQFDISADRITTLTFRKTYLRHEFEVRGGTDKELRKISREQHHSSAAITKKFIGLSN